MSVEDESSVKHYPKTITTSYTKINF